MHVRIHSISRTLFEGDIRSLTAPTLSGEITVLPHHRPLISELKRGVIKIVDPMQRESFFPLASGFLEVRPPNVSVLLDESS